MINSLKNIHRKHSLNKVHDTAIGFRLNHWEFHLGPSLSVRCKRTAVPSTLWYNVHVNSILSFEMSKKCQAEKL